ncbi:MAG: tetratricopeptide repeat protein [Patescibacteria group bacterium]|nr:tetratricopeptide repeat protein [Patescibacteria group bacterium]
MRFHLKSKKLWWGIGAVIVAAAVLSWQGISHQSNALEHAKALYQAGNVQEASKVYAKLLEGSGGLITAEVWNNYGNTLRDQNKLEEALEAYQKAIKIDGQYELAYRNLTYTAIDLAEDTNNPDQIADAIDILEAAYHKRPQSVILVENLITLYSKQGNTGKVSELKALREQLLAE